MKTILEELKESWKQPWPREEVLRPELIEVPDTGFEPVGTNVSTNAPKIETVETSVPVKRGRGGRPGPRRHGMDKIERRREVIKLMRQTPELTSKEIAKKLGESRGTVWHDILYIRTVIPELASWGIKARCKWINQYADSREAS